MSKESLTKCYQKKQRKIISEVRERYQNLSEEEKEKNHQHGLERYRNLPEVKDKGWLNIESLF